MRRPILGAVLCAALIVAWARPAAQAPAQFRAAIDLVQVDVSVLDRDRRPVRGLTATDFIVEEDGVPQRIAAFTAVDQPDVVTTSTSAGRTRAVAPDVTSNAVEERRLFVLVLDDSAIQADVFALASLKKVARGVIDRLAPADLMSVVYTMDNRKSQNFTNDHALLHAAVDRFAGGFRDMSAAPGADQLFLQYPINVLSEVSKFLAAVPERRKAIIYVGQGIPLDLEVANGLGLGFGVGGAIAARESQAGLAHQIPELFRRAQRANVNIYTMDVCGLRAAKPSPPTCLPGLETEFLQTIAEATGGRATINTNDFEEGITQVFTENSSYYLLGYQPTNPKRDGKLRRLTVKVNRPGVGVRVRSGYYATDDAKAEKDEKAGKATSPLATAMSGILPASDVPLRVAVAPFAQPGRKEAAVTIVLGVRQTVPSRAGGERFTESVDLQTRAFTNEGSERGADRQTARLVLRPGAKGEFEYEVLSRVVLAPGRYQLRLAAHVGADAIAGSVYADVEVPDFADLPLSLSGAVVSKTPAPASAPKSALASVIPVVPTAERTFSASDQVVMFLRAYQGGKAAMQPVAVRFRIENERGTVVFDEARDLTVAAFDLSSRAADIRFALPVNQLPSGDYLAGVEATRGASTSRRDVRFSVR